MMWIITLLKLAFTPAKITATAKEILELVVKFWKPTAIIGMILIIFYQNFMQFEALKWFGVRTIPGIAQEYDKKLANKDVLIAECEVSKARLMGAISSLNAQIDKWADISSQLQSQHNSLVAELTEMRKESEQAVQDILSGPTPESCEAAMKFLRDGAGELR